MEVLPKLLRFTLFGIAATSLFSVQPAQAYKVTLREVGASVVATGSGPINLTGLTFEAPGAGPIAPVKRGGETCTVDSLDRRVSGAGSASAPTLAAETLSALRPFKGSLPCQRAMSPVLLYRMT